MRIAILTGDNFSVIGGAQRLTIDTAKALDADVICPGYDENLVRMYDPEKSVRFISLNKKLPEEPLKQVSGKWLFRQASLDYDFYIAMDDMAVEYLRKGKPHLYYMLTPRRALYDMYYLYLANYGLIKSSGLKVLLGIARTYDRYFIKNYVENIACISHTVRNRICKQYQRSAEVIYPAIHTEKYYHRPSEGYWLSVGRVDKWKRIDLQIEAFRKMPDKQLIIAGPVYQSYESMKNHAPPNVKFLGPVSEEQLFELYARCEGFITTAIDEDFGITPLEAMASGKPVVATKEGGYMETVIDGIIGHLVSPDIVEICEKVKVISNDPESYCKISQKRAQVFDYSFFKERINTCVSRCTQTIESNGESLS